MRTYPYWSIRRNIWELKYMKQRDRMHEIHTTSLFCHPSLLRLESKSQLHAHSSQHPFSFRKRAVVVYFEHFYGGSWLYYEGYGTSSTWYIPLSYQWASLSIRCSVLIADHCKSYCSLSQSPCKKAIRFFKIYIPPYSIAMPLSPELFISVAVISNGVEVVAREWRVLTIRDETVWSSTWLCFAIVEFSDFMSWLLAS